ETYEVLASKALSGKARGVQGLSSPLVGRDAELGVLQAHLRELQQRGRALVAVLGEAGVGKSRLIADFRASADQGHDGLVWLEGRALSYGQTSSYLPWRDLLRQSIGALPEESPGATRDRIQTQVARGVLNAEDLPFLE